MNTTRLKQARRLFVHQNVSQTTARHNMRQWVASVRVLGDKWLAIKRVERIVKQQGDGL